VHPTTEEVIRPVNLLSEEGFHRIILEMVNNFTSFAPLGIVLVAMLGIGIAESSGLISAVIRLLVLSSPQKTLTFILVLAGVLSNLASNVGYVLLVPLAGVIFHTIGRHPIAGMAAAFAGVSGGFSANLIIGTIDPLLAGLSQEAARIVDPAYTVNPTANYYFMIASVFIIATIGTWVTEKIVVPRLGEYKGDQKAEELERLSKTEKKGVVWAFVTFVVFVGLILWGIIPEDGVLRGPEGGILESPLLDGVITFIFLLFGLTGLAFGIATNQYKNDSQVMKGMADSMKSLATYIVLVFFAAQFVAYFKWSNLGMIIAIKGANGLMATELGIIPLMILFILFAGTINMVMGSASAKWALLAPIFIPMFMFMGYSPELSQVVYRIGDSVTNIISPMMSFFALIIAFIQKYDDKAGIGTVISTMLPYSLLFTLAWILLLVGWILLGLPLGPDAGLYYTM
jgi:aminobenzoyl-glutamate transport protein